MERLSALMDGELDDHEVGAEVAAIKRDPDREATWTAYHVIGDVLRGQAVTADEFRFRLHANLDSEPTILAPRRWMRRASRRVALPLAASVCGVAVVAWLVLSNNVGILPHDAPVSPAMIAATPEAVEKDPSETNALSEYLMAHQQFSPSTAMQGVVSYVRTVSAGEASR